MSFRLGPAACLRRLAPLVLTVASGAMMAGCSAVGSAVFRQGAIQTAYTPQVRQRPDSPARGLTLAVPPFEESRRSKHERQTLWMCLVPGLSFRAYWERPDWLLWEGPVYAQYKPAGQDLAEVLAGEFERSGLFARVEPAVRPGVTDLVLEGDIRDLTLTERPHFLGTSFLVGSVLGVLGLPMGHWEVRQSLDLRLVEHATRAVVTQRQFHTSDRGIVAAYYGRDPLRRGYPADTLLAPVVAELVADVERALREKGAAHWLALAQRRGQRTPPQPPVRPPMLPTVPGVELKPRPPGRGWAIVVGISEYKKTGADGLAYLPFADDDARGVVRALKQLGWQESHIRALVNRDATREKIRAALESWLTKAGSGDLIVLYWSGHAFPDPADPDRVYFACHDTDVRKPISGYRMDKVLAALEERGARNVVVLADTCHAGKLTTRDISIVPRILREGGGRAAPKGWVFMLGADKDRKAVEDKAWTNGAFTHCLLKGLRGAADGFQSVGLKDGVVTMGELRTYLNTAMPDETQKALGVAKRPVIQASGDDPAIWNLTLRAQ